MHQAVLKSPPCGGDLGEASKKSGLPCSDKPLFCSFFYNDSYFLPRYCEKFLCHHQIFVILFIILLKIKNLLFRREAGDIWIKNTNMALTSCYLQKDPTTEAILYLYFGSCF
ncbi:MAG: hypothetical protein C0397_01165 [Odoribacter sp.]|nr:hypothetical protein [Odoribacter sp.]